MTELNKWPHVLSTSYFLKTLVYHKGMEYLEYIFPDPDTDKDKRLSTFFKNRSQ